uniref:ARID DNA-binding domain-containing protein n=1 Tax=Tanacetum cinerariifolium TaxID=118510 RepID=A0A6L2MIL7_TANCI|nr:ARID DNA-binding domain-containing protein [Tanacetum cinerariifolium]
MLKNKMKEVMQYNTTLNQPKSISNAQDKYKNYKCFKCKQLGHIIKFCPMDNKDEDMTLKTDTKRRIEGFKTTKLTVMLKYPETIYFFTTCMIRGSDLANWDEIWYVSNQIDRHVCYKLDAFCNIKEDFSVTKLENQMKFLFTYSMGEVLIEDGGQGFLAPGLSRENEEEIKRCYINYLDVFTSRFKTARAPQQGYNNTFVESAWKQRKIEIILDFTNETLVRMDHQHQRHMKKDDQAQAAHVMTSQSSLEDLSRLEGL